MNSFRRPERAPGTSSVLSVEHSRTLPAEAGGCFRILVVDDYEPIRDVLSRVLSRLGIVDTAGDGEAALAKTDERPYDLIVSDVDMPGTNGIEFYYRALAAHPALDDRFLFLTGHPSPGSLAFFRENRIPYLTKPVRPHEVEQAVAPFLERAACAAAAP